jgi:Transglycosylase SLT domain
MSLFEAYWSYSYADVLEQPERKVSPLERFSHWIAFPRSKAKLAPATRALSVAGLLATAIFVAAAAPHSEIEKRTTLRSAHAPSPVLSLANADDFPLDADFSLQTAAQTWERRLFAKAEPYDPELMRFGTQKVQRSIVERVVKAAAETGSDPALLLSIADKESSFILKAKASTSSASGLFQFIDSTWMTAMKAFGGRHLQQEAKAPQAEGGAKPAVAATSRAELLKLRNDPYLSAVLAAEILKHEGAKISEEIGRTLTAGETYLIHFLGPDDARRFMAKMDQDPQAPAAKLLPRPARANRSIFFASLNGRLKAKSLREVHDAFEAMMMARVDRFRDAEARVPDAIAAANAAGATAYVDDK